MRTKIIIVTLTGLPILLSFLLAITSQYIAIIYCQDQINLLSEQLFGQQIMFTKAISESVSWQISYELQQFPINVKLLNTFYSKVLSGSVTPNKNHKLSMVHTEILYKNQEDPQLTALYHQSPILVNSWFHKNISHIAELSSEGQNLISNVSRLQPFLRTFEVERNINQVKSSRSLIYNLAFIGYQYEGMMIMNTLNSTYVQAPDPVCGVGVLTNYDPRCRPWFKFAANQYSVHFQQPVLSFTEKVPYLGQSVCQRMLQWNSTTKSNQVHHVLCFNIKLTALQNYFNNYAKSTSQTYVIDPSTMIVLFDSANRLNTQSAMTLLQLELNNLQSKESAFQVNQTIQSQFPQSILFDQIDSSAYNQSNAMQIINPYIRNGTKTQILYNPIYVYDKLPQPKGDYSFLMGATTENIKEVNYKRKDSSTNSSDSNRERKLQNQQNQQNGQNQWNALLAYLQINIITDEDLKNQSNSLNAFFDLYFIVVSCIFLTFGIISILVSVIYALKIGHMLMYPIEKLIQILINIHQCKDLNEICYLLEDDEVDIDEIFQSKELRKLYESLNEVVKIMKFTSENFYLENATKTLLNLHDYLKFFEKFQNNHVLGVIHNNIGCIFLSQNHYHQALEQLSHSILQVRYEIKQFYKKNPNLINSKALFDHSLEDFQALLPSDIDLKTIKSISINPLSHHYQSMNHNSNFNNSNSIRRQTKFTVQNNPLDINEECNRTLNAFNEESINPIEAKLNKRYTVNKKQISVNVSNVSNTLMQEQVDLLCTLYFRKKNYIITMMAYQDHMDELKSQNKIKDHIIYHNYWQEIKQLLKELLNIAIELPFWESQQVEILLNITKCYFKLGKNKKYHALMKFCESATSKLRDDYLNQSYQANNQIQFDLNNKLYNSNGNNTIDSPNRRSQHLQRKSREQIPLQILSNNQSLNNSYSNLTVQKNNLLSTNRKINNFQFGNKLQNILQNQSPMQSFKETNKSQQNLLKAVNFQKSYSDQMFVCAGGFDNSDKLNQLDSPNYSPLQIKQQLNNQALSFFSTGNKSNIINNNESQYKEQMSLQQLHNRLTSKFTLQRYINDQKRSQSPDELQVKQKQQQSLIQQSNQHQQQQQQIQKYQQELISSPRKTVQYQSRNTFSRSYQSPSIYQMSKKSTKSSVYSNGKIDDNNNKSNNVTVKAKTDKIDQDQTICEGDELECSNKASINSSSLSSIYFHHPFRFDFMFGKAAIEQIMDLMKAEYFQHIGQFSTASDILSGVLENHKQILTHVPFILKKRLTDMFTSRQIYSYELQCFSNQFNQQLKLQVALIYSERTVDGKDIYDENYKFEDRHSPIQSNLINSNTVNQIVLFQNLIERVLTHNEDSLSIIKVNRCVENPNNINCQSLVDQLLTKKIKQPSLISYILDRIVDYKSLFQQTKVNSNIASQWDISIDSKLFSQLDEQHQDYSQLKQYSPPQTQLQTVKTQNNDNFSQIKSNIVFKNPFNSLHQRTSSFEEIGKNEQQLLNKQNSDQKRTTQMGGREDDFYSQENQAFEITNSFNSIGKQTMNQRNSLLKIVENAAKNYSLTSLKINKDSIQEDSKNTKSAFDQKYFIPSSNNEVRQNNNNNQPSYSDSALLKNFSSHKRNRNNQVLFKSASNNNLANSGSSSRSDSFSNQSVGQAEKRRNEIISKNQQFHYSMRKAISNLISPMEDQFQQLQNSFNKMNSLNLCVKNTFYTNSHSKLRRFVIYQTDKIEIIENSLFFSLCETLLNYNIYLILFSNQPGNNFLEERQDFYFKAYRIRIYYSLEHLSFFLEAQRNKFNQQAFPTYLQHV